MPLSEAFYLSGTDKIYGVMSNYVLKFNATTGLKEASARVCAPMIGPMRIIGRGSSLYVASMWDMSLTAYGASSNRTIWTVDPNTLVATDALGTQALVIVQEGEVGVWHGPNAMFFNGDKLYWQQSNNIGSASYMFIDVTTPATHDVLSWNGVVNWTPETWDYDGTTYIVACDPTQQEVEIYNPTLAPGAQAGYSSTIPDPPVSVVWADNVGFAYAVCGNESLYRLLTYTPTHTSTLHNLGVIAPNCAPTRIRYINGLLYLPCQKTDVIIVWNPVTDTGIVKSGFESPIDVIWTGTKLWAVQTSIQSLKEIT